MAHVGGNKTLDGTYVGGTNSFVGQLYFPMETIEAVGVVSPYSNNKTALLRNENDSLFKSTDDVVAGWDGLMEVRQIGESIKDGLIGWISVGIDLGADQDTGNTAGGNTAVSKTVNAAVSSSSAPAVSSSSSSSSSSSASADATAKNGMGSAVAVVKTVAAGIAAVVGAVLFWA